MSMRMAVFTLCLLLISQSINAQSGRLRVETYDEVIKGAQSIEPSGNAAFGDETNLFDGQTSFRIADITAKTKSGLDVSLRRKLSLNNRDTGTAPHSYEIPLGVLDSVWQLDTPYMHGIFESAGWVSYNNNPNTRCSEGVGTAPRPVYGWGPFYNTIFNSLDYWSGNSINIPSIGEEAAWNIRHDRLANTMPSNGDIYKGVTKSNWFVSCIPSLRRGNGEGFKVTLPNGVSYDFDWMVEVGAPPIMAKRCMQSGCSNQVALPRKHVYIYATKVTDRHGNWVKYEYDGSHPHRLNRVLSNDGAQIDIAYLNNRINSATSHGRTWGYSYDNGVFSVIQPDGARWTSSYTQYFESLARSDYERLWMGGCTVNVRDMTSNSPPAIGNHASITITSPSGASGKFDFRKIIHGTNNTLGYCYLDVIVPPHTEQRFDGIPKVYQAVSL